MDMGMACWAGERMFSTSEGEDMGVKGKEGCKGGVMELEDPERHASPFNEPIKYTCSREITVPEVQQVRHIRQMKVVSQMLL
jgi:hypothetical protein